MQNLEANPLVNFYKRIEQQKQVNKTTTPSDEELAPSQSPFILEDNPLAPSVEKENELLEQYGSQERATEILTQFHEAFPNAINEICEYFQSTKKFEYDINQERTVLEALLLFSMYYIFLYEIANQIDHEQPFTPICLDDVQTDLKDDFSWMNNTRPIFQIVSI
jgi:hypothetical protein